MLILLAVGFGWLLAMVCFFVANAIAQAGSAEARAETVTEDFPLR